MKKYVYFDEDNLIYNRYDLIYPNDFAEYIVSRNETDYKISMHEDNGVTMLDIWGKMIPSQIMEDAVDKVFENKSIYAIDIARARNNYHDLLEETNDIRVPLPKTTEELWARSKSKHRTTIKKNCRWLSDDLGEIRLLKYHKEIPNEIVNTFFLWKKASHNIEYRLAPQEYLSKYFVTDSLFLTAGEMNVAVIFYCVAKDIAYLENLSYNPLLKKYSPGTLIYVKLLEELIKRNCRFIYLGGGDYIYKKRFGAEDRTAYTGRIYRKEIFDILNEYFADIGVRNVAIYGLGGCFAAFSRMTNYLNIQVEYGIDQEKKTNRNIRAYLPQDELPPADAALITLNKKITEVEKYLYDKFDKVLYWNDVLEGAVNQYKTIR